MISFIIPTKNEEKFLEKTLHYISKYSGAHEIIISDGGSKDATIEIARKYTDKIAVHAGSERQTIAGGRNAGATLASGDYLVFMDADVTIFDPGTFFAKAESLFVKNSQLVALTSFIRVLPEVETFFDRLFFGLLNYMHLISNNFFHVGDASGEFQMIRADVFRKVGGFNEKFVAAEDQEMFRRLARVGRTLCDKKLVIYHTGRRPHTVGWPKLLSIWIANALSVQFFKRAASKEWKEVR